MTRRNVRCTISSGMRRLTEVHLDSSREIREEAPRIGNSILIMMTDQWTTFLEISLAECSMDLIREVLDPVRALQAAVVSAADLAAAGALTAEALAADFPEGRKALI